MAIVCSGVGEINPLLDYTVEKPTIETNVMGWTFVIDMLYNIFEHQKQGHLIDHISWRITGRTYVTSL